MIDTIRFHMYNIKNYFKDIFDGIYYKRNKEKLEHIIRISAYNNFNCKEIEKYNYYIISKKCRMDEEDVKKLDRCLSYHIKDGLLKKGFNKYEVSFFISLVNNFLLDINFLYHKDKSNYFLWMGKNNKEMSMEYSEYYYNKLIKIIDDKNKIENYSKILLSSIMDILLIKKLDYCCGDILYEKAVNKVIKNLNGESNIRNKDKMEGLFFDVFATIFSIKFLYSKFISFDNIEYYIKKIKMNNNNQYCYTKD